MRIASLFFLVLLSACASYEGGEAFEIKTDVYYSQEQNSRLQADLYTPKGSGPFPAVILVHGGGWKSRSRKDMDSIAVSLATNGMAVMNINYRFAPEHLHPSPIDDLKAAVEFLKKHHQLYRVNQDRIGLWGYSSGGHTVSYYALKYSDHPQLKVKAVVAGGAPYDFTWYPKSPYIKGYMGKYRDDMLQEYVDASVFSLINKSGPPFFLYHAMEDELVEFAQMSAFAARLKLAGISVKTHPISFWGHATGFALPDRPVELGVKFLKKSLLECAAPGC
jgi:acetyl esterase/lipase